MKPITIVFPVFSMLDLSSDLNVAKSSHPGMDCFTPIIAIAQLPYEH
ncbi:hypothetical protein [Paenibacillus campi]|nr:hypothetical protein [Paenibacillus sp. SGZ-1014]